MIAFFVVSIVCSSICLPVYVTCSCVGPNSIHTKTQSRRIDTQSGLFKWIIKDGPMQSTKRQCHPCTRPKTLFKPQTVQSSFQQWYLIYLRRGVAQWSMNTTENKNRKKVILGGWLPSRVDARGWQSGTTSNRSLSWSGIDQIDRSLFQIII